MNINTAFEIKAEAFRIITGMLAPGKDASAADNAHSYEERLRRWGDWLSFHHEIINAMLRSFDQHNAQVHGADPVARDALLRPAESKGGRL